MIEFLKNAAIYLLFCYSMIGFIFAVWMDSIDQNETEFPAHGWLRVIVFGLGILIWPKFAKDLLK